MGPADTLLLLLVVVGKGAVLQLVTYIPTYVAGTETKQASGKNKISMSLTPQEEEGFVDCPSFTESASIKWK